ncbi:MAG TPA: alpha-2-macroglobulin family protein [Ilumatobacter sp.]|nr:alpha-2-macroglobulin family protein [Ilumatobacter sp.]
MRRRLVAVVLAGGLLAGACTRDGGRTLAPPAIAPPTTAPGDTTPAVVIDNPPTPRIVLTDGSPEPLRADPIPVLAGEPLGDDEIDDALGRLPAWDVPGDDTADTNFPAERIDPPIPGETVATPFPPPVDPPPDPAEQPATGPLMVLRYQPEGEVATAPFLSVTFDQPMVPLATLDQLDDVDVPVTLTPSVEGRWRWIGTRTARFEVVPAGDGSPDRLPAATEYSVTVPAGTTSANGAVLAEAVTWTFATPAPTVASLTGVSDSMPVRPVFVAVFDQQVDPAAVLATVTATAGGEPVDLRRATAADVDGNPAAKAASDGALPGRAVAFTVSAALPSDTVVKVAIGPGTPSAEGPRASATAHEVSGRTFGALRVVEHGCQRSQRRCQPGDTLYASFNNQLDTDGLDAAGVAELITVAPEITGMQIRVYESWVEIVGATTARTTYTVTFAAGLADVHGQTLGEPVELTYEIGSADPALQGFAREFVTVDPMDATAQVSFSSINHDTVHVTAWAVTPADAGAFREYLERTYGDANPAAPNWPVVFDRDVAVDAERDRWAETFVDLGDAFAQSGGQLVVRVASKLDIGPRSDQWWQNRPTVAWVQRTTLGIDAFTDGRSMVVWTTDLVTGQPVGNATVELVGSERTVTTDADGLASIDGAGQIGVLHATAGDRTAMLVGDWWSSWSAHSERPAQSRWYVVDDRGMYRPGETVRLAGWVREFAWDDDAQLRQYGRAGDEHSIDYVAYDGYGAELGRGSVATNALAGFNLAVELPAGANLGQGWVELHVNGPGVNQNNTHHHSFQIQEFRRPEFEVSARAETPPPYFLAGGATVAVDATYYAGGGLANAEVQWLISTSDTTYAPPGWDDYRFGVSTPWWWGGGRSAVADIGCWDCPGTNTTHEEFTGRTDAEGTHLLRIGFAGDDGAEAADDLPRSVTAEATVYDVNRQAWADRTNLLVHAAEQYVGLRSQRSFVEQGTPIRVDAIVADIDGAAVAGRPVSVTAGRVTWDLTGGEWAERVVDPQTCEFDSTDTAHECEFVTDAGGQYRITAVVTDADGHHNRTELTVWVAGGTGRPVRGVEQEQLTVVPAADEFTPGDTAELLVQAPFAPATGTYTVLHGPIRETRAFSTDDGSAVLRIPIGADDVPTLTVSVEMVGVAPRTNDDGTPAPDAPARPAYASGRIALPVSLAERTLDVTAVPADDALEPGAETSVTVTVTGPNGAPVEGAGVALVVVDEAVLALSGYELADPLGVFYSELYDDLWGAHARGSILLTRADLAGGTAASTTAPPGAPAPAADMAYAEESTALGGEFRAAAASDGDDSAGSSGQPIEVRENFDALAVFAPNEVTGADGTVTVDVELPDSLTRYRVMAIAVDGATNFGKGESTITARLPLMVRPSAPRFLNFGDTFELPVVLQNQTDQALDVLVAVETANLTLIGPVGKRVTVPANDRVEVRFPAAAAEPGTARYRVVAVSADATLGFADAAAGALPVYTPATAEAFATYGVLDGGGVVGQPVLAPDGVLPQFGGLEVTTSSTAVSALTDAVLYITDYPYQSSDALAGRIMSIATLGDVLEAFGVEGLPAPEVLDQRVVDDIAALVRMRNDDGGWAWYTRGRPSDPWLSATATHALVVARAAGFSVPQGDLDAALAFLANIEAYIPAEWGPEARTAVRSYALYMRDAAGAGDPAKAAAVYREAGAALQLDAMAWLWTAIDNQGIRAEIARTLANRAVDTAGATTFATSYGEQAYLIAASDRRTDAIVLDALITEAPDSDLIAKTVAGLMAGQTRGRWNNVYENSFALIALHRYFTTFESVTPDFVARAWLGDTYVAEHQFAGRGSDRSHTLVPMETLIDTGDTSGPLVVANDGEGRLYYRLGVRYAPADLTLAPRDEGFVVDRVYEAVDDPADVTRDADGTWHIRAGAKVRVKLTMVADAVRTHVALIDPLPAGLEALNPALANTQTVPPPTVVEPVETTWWGWPWWSWYEHENLGDDRVEAVAGYLPGGIYEYDYIARATTPGEFVVPPTRAEQIYAPEVFGRSASTTVVVE